MEVWLNISIRHFLQIPKQTTMKKTTFFRAKSVALTIGFVSLLQTIVAQEPVIRCYTDEQHAIRMAEHPELESKADFEQWIQEAMDANAGSKIIGGVYQIPVVVHVIHNGEAVGSGTNVSTAAIQSQIDVLNEDFRKILGSNGHNTDPVGADTQIEFCLAQRRPDGSAFPAGSTGINRINRTTAGFTAPPYSTGYIDGTIKAYTYNNNVPTATRGWDPAKYMNIWLCNISGGILGYAQFPETPIGGMGCGNQADGTDGVVFLYNSIGKSAVTGFAGPYNEGRTATHEVGHWLGLRHIWGDGGCTVDDFCNDTPEAGSANYGCPTGTNSCTGSPGNDMINNYMDYTDDLCMDIFTNDQKARMRTVLESSPLRVSLINSDACILPNANDASIIDVINPKGDNCGGSLIPTVTIKNRGSSNLTSATINYKIDNGSVTTFSYSGTLTPGSTANVALPAFTAALGNHLFQSYPTLPNGVADPSPLYDTTGINFVVSNGIMAPFSENFDGSVFPPDVRWVVENANNDCYKWVSQSCTSITGIFNNNAAQMPSFGNTTGGTENLVTPIFILPCNATVANIQFDVAYRRRNATPANYERLYIEISQDCGNTWTTTPIYDKTGTALQVLTTTTTAYYQPVGTSDWRTETVDLLSFVTGTSKNVKFRFRAVAANGNNIYVDNFRFNATTPGEIRLTQAGNDVLDGGFHAISGTTTTCATTNTTFIITNTGTTNLTLTGPISITGSAFTVGTTFGSTTLAAGATTTFVIAFTPTSAGSFSETISFGTNDCDEGTYNFLINGTATGSPCGAVASFTATPNPVCVGQAVTFTSTSTGATSYNWNFGTGATPPTASTQGPHTVTYSSAGTKATSLTINGSVTANNNVVVNSNPTTPTISAGGSTTFCTGGSVVLTSTSATSYLWSTGATTQSITVSNSGSYTVTVTNASSCSATSAPTTVTVNPIPATPSASNGGPYTVGQNIQLSTPTVAGATYAWTGCNGFASLIQNPTISSPTTVNYCTYCVTVTVSGCTSAPGCTTVIGNPPTPTISAGGPTTFCSGGSVVLTSSSTTGNTWSTGATTQSITVTSSGTYTVTVSNGSGSATSSPTTVTVNTTPPTPTVSSGSSTTFCSGGSVVLTSSSASGNTWSTGATTQSITVTSAGSYSVTVGSAGCSASSTPTTVTVNTTPSTPTIATSGSTTFCSGGSVVLTSSSSTGNTWSTGETTQSITVNSSGSYTVSVASGGCNSANSSATNVTVNSNTTPTFTALGPYCQGAVAGTLPTTSNNAINGTWSPSTINTATVGSATYTFTPSAGVCATTTTMTVVINSPTVPNFVAPGPFCQGATGTTLANTSPNGITGTWSPSSSINTSIVGSSTYTYTPTSGVCATTQTISVVINSPTTPTFISFPPYCVDDTPANLQTTSNNGISGTWSPATISTATAGSATYTFTPNVGLCATTTTITVVVDACAGIVESSVNTVLVYPNPSSGIITIDEGTLNIESIEVFNALGQLVLKKQNSFTKMEVNLTHVANGVYTLSVLSKNGVIHIPIVIEK